jgi:MFS transporter, FHS family, L-fucose permease
MFMTENKASLVPTKLILPFMLVTSLFALWGFANDITNPMVAAFKNILLISNFESSLVQFAFYGGYGFMAFPAALFIKRYSYKRGILLGLILYAIGCFCFIPAGGLMVFWAFLLSYFIMTCGLAFLETCSNPYILSMGDAETATRRLNLAQSFNPMGSILGMFVAKNVILERLNPLDEAGRTALRGTSIEAFNTIAASDLSIIILPYTLLGIVVTVFVCVFFFARLPSNPEDENRELDILPTLKRLLKNAQYIEGVIAQMFYVGVQIMCWTFIIQYAEKTLGLTKADAQFYNIIAMVMFVSSRFICTLLLKYINQGMLLLVLATCGGLLMLHTIFGGGNMSAGAEFKLLLQQSSQAGFWAHLLVYLKAPFVISGMSGLVTLILASSCMSLMFPTIYGVALRDVGKDAKIASAGLVMSIVGGCLMTPMQGWIMDQSDFNLCFTTLSSVRMSFILPFICFLVIAAYGYRTLRHPIIKD